MTALLLMRVPRSSYAHWMTCPSRSCTLSIPVMVIVCSVLATTVYTAPGKVVSRTWPLINVPLCIHSGAELSSLCLQMRVSWFEQFPPCSFRETAKAAVKGSTPTQNIYEDLQLLTVHTGHWFYTFTKHNQLIRCPYLHCLEQDEVVEL